MEERRCCRFPAHFVSKLTDSDGELNETRHWPSRAEAYEYLPPERAAPLHELADEIGRMLGKMISKRDSFAGA